MRLQTHEGRDLYLVNAHAPDSGQSTAKKEAFQRRLEAALDAEKHGDLLALMGDFNASTGIAEDANDEVCGEFGIPTCKRCRKKAENDGGNVSVEGFAHLRRAEVSWDLGPRPVEKLASAG
jgi:hypothetical protein